MPPRSPAKGANEDVSPSSGRDPTLFRGLKLYFRTKSHVSILMKRARENGAEIQDKIGDDTTHVVCTSRGVSAKKERGEKRAREKREEEGEEGDGRREQELGGQEAGKGANQDDKPFFEQGITLVTPAWLSDSILQGKLQNPDDYKPKLVGTKEAREAHGNTSSSAEVLTPPQSRKRLRYSLPPSVMANNPTSTRREARPTKETDSEEERTRSGASQDIIMGTARRAMEKSKSRNSSASDDETASCIVERRGADWVVVQGHRPAFTGGQTGIPWGAFGVWNEPFDEEKARDTINILWHHWHRNIGRHPERFRDNLEEESIDRGPTSESKPSNGICKHIACARRPFCIIQRLEEIKDAYLPGRDFFQLRALDETIGIVARHSSPLETPRDVDNLGLGKKSSLKVKEILETGRSSRLDDTPELQRTKACANLMRIWGVGDSIARQWYDAGCRTPEDAKQKAAAGTLKLTEQQQLGLKYLDDFEIKIPREDVSVAESIVRELTFEIVEQLGATDAERTYCSAAGSYIRGKSESSDVDILISLPPSLINIHCGEALHRLLHQLLQKDFLLDEMRPGDRHGGRARASFMGACRIPGPRASIARRIDIKVYNSSGGKQDPPDGYMTGTVMCVDYFASSMPFCRALRLYATTHVSETARKELPEKTDGFKLSDTEMLPRDIHGAVLGESLCLACETELFEYLGLAYVPPRLRHFEDTGPG